MASVLIYLVLFAIAFFRFTKQGKGKNAGTGKSTTRPSGKSSGKTSGKRPLASDGHRVSRDQDISCRRFGHQHEEFDTPRFIPHNEPEEGYIILNGVKMKRTEADRYEDRI